MKQSSIEWLVKQLNDKVDFIPLNKWDEIRDLVQQSKAMHKEEMIDFSFKYGDLTMQEMSDSFDKEYK